jgi:hypothetical protein
MSRKTIAMAMVFALLMLGCIGSGAYLAVRWSNNCQYIYTGKEVFQTEQEYTAFKDAVVASDASIVGTSSLSSSPPIIIEFHVTTDHTAVPFPYGTKQGDDLWQIGMLIVILGAGTVSIPLMTLAWEAIGNRKKKEAQQ